MAGKQDRLTERQEKCANIYIKHTLLQPIDGWTWIKSMREAGYTDIYANRYSAKIYRQSNIQKFIDDKRAEITKETHITAGECIQNIRWGIDQCKEKEDLKALASFTKIMVGICSELQTIAEKNILVQVNTQDMDEKTQLEARLKRLEAVEQAPDALYVD